MSLGPAQGPKLLEIFSKQKWGWSNGSEVRALTALAEDLSLFPELILGSLRSRSREMKCLWPPQVPVLTCMYLYIDTYTFT